MVPVKHTHGAVTQLFGWNLSWYSMATTYLGLRADTCFFIYGLKNHKLSRKNFLTCNCWTSLGGSWHTNVTKSPNESCGVASYLALCWLVSGSAAVR